MLELVSNPSVNFEEVRVPAQEGNSVVFVVWRESNDEVFAGRIDRESTALNRGL